MSYFRRPHTHGERRQNAEPEENPLSRPLVRAKRRRLPTDWDDLGVRAREDRSWKRFTREDKVWARRRLGGGNKTTD